MAQPPEPSAAMQPVLRVLRLPLGIGPKIAAAVLLVIVVVTLLSPWIRWSA